MLQLFICRTSVKYSYRLHWYSDFLETCSYICMGKQEVYKHIERYTKIQFSEVANFVTAMFIFQVG